ncbi:MAG: hypothetical protein WC026_13010 [Hyphomicrobium sp.]|uniref:hypothetical protein n=1 Tax=Hyphomicrobium sp. TaxID=82 RepID=UPI00356B4645
MGSIKINGKVFETFKDEEGIERFKPNNLILNMKINFDIKVSELMKLVHLKSITLMDLLDYYAAIGFTVSGVQELSFFENYDFVRDENNNSNKSTSLLIPQYKEELLECIQNLMGVFDTPISRRQVSGKFVEEARKIGREILESNKARLHIE